jgi:hypothetical protein
VATHSPLRIWKTLINIGLLLALSMAGAVVIGLVYAAWPAIVAPKTRHFLVYNTDVIVPGSWEKWKGDLGFAISKIEFLPWRGGATIDIAPFPFPGGDSVKSRDLWLRLHTSNSATTDSAIDIENFPMVGCQCTKEVKRTNAAAVNIECLSDRNDLILSYFGSSSNEDELLSIGNQLHSVGK